MPLRMRVNSAFKITSRTHMCLTFHLILTA
uniref:Uncharacterized protein n=1 Tax=Anguilla anguilla TaxID=7936 RepID=A0A0E9T7U0_ANGAN